MKVRGLLPAEKQDELLLQHRILNIALVFGVVMCAMGTIVNVFAGLGAILTAITVGGVVLYGGLYYLSIARVQYGTTMLVALITFMVAFVPTFWIYNAGMFGSIPYYIIIFSSIIAVLLSGVVRYVFMFYLTAIIGILIYVQYEYPFLIQGYSSYMARFIDMSIGLVLAVVANTILFAVIVSDYKKENHRVREYLLRIETANTDLQREMNDRWKAEEALRDSENNYRTLFETAGTAMVIIEEDGIISLVNEEFVKLSGWAKPEVEGKIACDQFVSVKIARAQDGLCAPLKNYEMQLYDKHGEARDVIISISLIPGTWKRVASFVDISNVKQVEARLKYLATHDYLTGVPNRYSFEESLKQAVIKAGRGRASALLFIDIDNFKLINDANGHAAGDDYLVNITGAIRENLREGDILARLGGDEFGVLLEDTTVETAMVLAERLRRATENEDFCSARYGCFNSSFSIDRRQPGLPAAPVPRGHRPLRGQGEGPQPGGPSRSRGGNRHQAYGDQPVVQSDP